MSRLKSARPTSSASQPDAFSKTAQNPKPRRSQWPTYRSRRAHACSFQRRAVDRRRTARPAGSAHIAAQSPKSANVWRTQGSGGPVLEDRATRDPFGLRNHRDRPYHRSAPNSATPSAANASASASPGGTIAPADVMRARWQQRPRDAAHRRSPIAWACRRCRPPQPSRADSDTTTAYSVVSAVHVRSMVPALQRSIAHGVGALPPSSFGMPSPASTMRPRPSPCPVDGNIRASAVVLVALPQPVADHARRRFGRDSARVPTQRAARAPRCGGASRRSPAAPRARRRSDRATRPRRPTPPATRDLRSGGARDPVVAAVAMPQRAADVPASVAIIASSVPCPSPAISPVDTFDAAD